MAVAADLRPATPDNSTWATVDRASTPGTTVMVIGATGCLGSSLAAVVTVVAMAGAGAALRHGLAALRPGRTAATLTRRLQLTLRDRGNPGCTGW